MTRTETQAPIRTYRGNCHCGDYVYEARLPEITSVHECNCSICRKKGYLGVFLGVDDDFRVVKGADDGLVSYTFGPGKLAHKVLPRPQGYRAIHPPSTEADDLPRSFVPSVPRPSWGYSQTGRRVGNGL